MVGGRSGRRVSTVGRFADLLRTSEPRDFIPLDPRDAGIEVWRDADADGTVAAYGRSSDGAHRMDVPGVASFWFGEGEGDQVVAIPEPSGRSDLVEDAYSRMVLPMVLHVRGMEVLHASAVLTRSGVLALSAVSGTGKSTIAYAMSRAGCQLWGDDAVAFDVSSRPVTSIALPFEMGLRAPSTALLGVADAADNPVAAPAVEEDHVPLTALFVLSRQSGGARKSVDIRRVRETEAFRAVLTHAYSFTLEDRDRKRRMINAYLRLVTHVPVYHLRFTPRLETLQQIVDEITSTAGV